MIDNGPYYLRNESKVPRKCSAKKIIREFLEASDLYYEDNCTKEQLLEVANMK